MTVLKMIFLGWRCSRLNSVLDCVDRTMRGCATESDPYDSITIYWKRTSEGLKYICHDRRRGTFE